MLASFRDRFTEGFWRTGRSRRFGANLSRVARRKLAQLHFASTLKDLRAPPGNRLEPLAGDRRGQHSIRINDQWRVCFAWREDDAWDVEITDYH